MKILQGPNLGLRFALELGALAAVGYWGWETGDGWTRWLLAVAAIAAVAVVWGLFVSPKASIETPRPLTLAIELAVWLAAGAALYSTGHEELAAAFVVAAVISGTLNALWR